MQTLYRPIVAWFRKRRNALFGEIMQPGSADRILDVGGNHGYWANMGCAATITCLNVAPPEPLPPLPPRCSYVRGDGRHLPYEDRSFDIVFSNSVIEHVGTWEDQQRFAKEIRRTGRSFWVQTPNRWFVVEPHLIAPLVHFLPRSVQRRLLRRITPWGWLTHPTPQEVDEFLSQVRLLTLKEMRELFPEATIYIERFFGLAKSFVAVRQGRRETLRTNILGTEVAAIDLPAALDLVTQRLGDAHYGSYICVTGVHGVTEGLRDVAVRHVHNKALACVPDGMPLTWVGRIRGHRGMRRVYGPDLMLSVLESAAQRGWSNYFYGGAEGVAGELAGRMRKMFPGLRIAGTHSPPFRALTAEERTGVLDRINALEPDIVWIGLSTPKQELLMADFSPDIRAKLMIGVGAAFDFHTGRVRQAPRWVQRIGMEWCFRLCMEPRRLAKRYVRNNPAFLWHIALQLTGLRRYPCPCDGGEPSP